MIYLKNIVLFLFILLQFSCGQDGKDGEIFLRIRSILTPMSFSIENLDLPQPIQYDVYYKTNPGSYPFTYVDHNNVAHPLPGEFSVIDIIASPGQSGSLFKSGEDGDDIYIDLILLSTGPIIENFDYFTIASTLDYYEE